jgi:O-Antigen ligase
MSTLAARLLRPIAILSPLRPVRAIGRWLARVVESSPPTLGGYERRKAPAREALVKRIVYAMIIFVGIFYGLMVAIFPMFLYLYMAIPIVFLLLLIIWALPETDNPPVGLMEWLFWGFFLSLLVWPNYLALTLPGLPWITLIRLFTAPLVLVLLINISMAPSFRQKLRLILRDNKWITRTLVAFIIIQAITVLFSRHPADSLNRYISHLLECTAMFFAGAFIFSQEGRAQRWAKWLCIAAVALCLMAFFEFRKGGVLWAGHIPSFLAVADESVQRTLSGSARASTGIYRLQSVFATSLNFAEVLGLSTVFFVHFMFSARRPWVRLASAVYLPYHFWVIWGTDSRLGMVGFFGSLLGYLLVWSVRRWRTHKNDVIAPALVLAYPVILSGFIAASFLWQRLNRMIWGGGPQTASNESRKQQWSLLWPNLEKWPLGYGSGESGDILGFTNGAGVVSVDSYYITTLIEFGILGFFAFFGMVTVSAVTAYSLSGKSKQPELQLMLPIFVMLVTFIFIKAVLSGDDSHALIFMAIGMVASMKHRYLQESASILPDLKSGNLGRRSSFA